jgi:hypothetical protein
MKKSLKDSVIVNARVVTDSEIRIVFGNMKNKRNK